MRTLLCGLAVALAVLLAGCSSHKEELEREAPPRPVDAAADGQKAASAAVRLIGRYEKGIEGLSAEALAPLAQASAKTFEATGAPGLRNKTRLFADRLLDARVTAGSGTAFFGFSQPGRPDRALTSVAAGALIDAFRVTGDPRYRSAALDAVVAITSRRLGWRKVGRLAGVAESGSARLNVALTAEAAFVLTRVSEELEGAIGPDAPAAYKTVLESQAAVGNWYATVGGKNSQTLEEWAITLQSLFGEGSKESIGVAGGGVLKLREAAFTSGGRPADNDLVRLSPAGVAQSLELFQASGHSDFADTGVRAALENRRPDGTIRSADRTASDIQAQYALAFALRASALLGASRRDSRG